MDISYSVRTLGVGTFELRKKSFDKMCTTASLIVEIIRVPI